MYDTAGALSEMADAYAAALQHLAEGQGTPAPGDHLQAKRDWGDAQRGRQLAPLLPAIPWKRLEAAATSIAGAGDQSVVDLLRAMESFYLGAQAVERHPFPTPDG
jgi:hypothetical protein